MLIYGAGMAGLLAAHMLRRFEPTVIEAQQSLPNNHDALLRFRSDAVSQATGIPFRKVLVHKAICYNNKLYDKANIKFSNMYSSKVTGRIISRSIINLEPGERYIAPPDFIAQMARGLNIRYGQKVETIVKHDYPVISTLPMPFVMQAVGFPEPPDFGYQQVTTISCTLDGVDLYQTLYYPGDEEQYRASITGNKLMIEIASDIWTNFDNHDSAVGKLIDSVMCDFGIYNRIRTNIRVTKQKYGKILPIDNDVRKQFILAMTDLYNMYSVGRFGTWRQILLDDVVRDIKLVERMITERSSYAAKLASIQQ